MRKNEKGFTLVELIVVIAIVAILAAVGIVGYTQFIQNARETKAKSELDQIVNVMYADALVSGIMLKEEVNEGVTTYSIVTEGGTVYVKADTGKLQFLAGTPTGVITALFANYGEGLTGTLTLETGKLVYDDGNAEVSVQVGSFDPPTP